MFTIGNDQVKAAGKDYANVKPVRLVSVCLLRQFYKKQKTQSLFN